MIGGVPKRIAIPALGAALALYLYAGTRLGCSVDGTRIYALADDPLISMRYARNLAEGAGLVWNAGEPPVEGISNLLWTLWMALGHALGLPDTHTSLWVVAGSALSLVACALYTAKVADRIRPGHPWVATFAMLAAALYWPTIRWSVVGFEVGAAAALTAAGVYYALPRAAGREHKRAMVALGVTSCLALALRLDAAAIFVPLGALVLFRAEDGKARVEVLTWVAAPCVLLLAAMTGWRLTFYGEWVPNTFILKGTGVELSDRFWQGLNAIWDTFQTHLAVFLLPPLVAFADPEAERKGLRTIALVLAAQGLFLLYIGGDTWEEPQHANRQFSTVVPVAMALVAIGFGHLHAGWVRAGSRRVAAALMVVAVAGSAWLVSLRAAKAWLAFDHCSTALWPKIELARHLKSKAPPDTRVAVVWAGAVPYFSHLPAIDLLGKSDPVIARRPARHSWAGHNKWDYTYSIGELQPDVVVDLYAATPEDIKAVSGYGYQLLPDGVWYRRGSHIPLRPGTPDPRVATFLPLGSEAPPPQAVPEPEKATPERGAPSSVASPATAELAGSTAPPETPKPSTPR